MRLKLFERKAVCSVIHARLGGDDLPAFDLAPQARRGFDGMNDRDLAFHPEERTASFVLALLQSFGMHADRKGPVIPFGEDEAIRRWLDRVNRSTDLGPFDRM